MQCGRPRFDHWAGKILWSREWLPTPVFLPGKSHGQRSLSGYSPWACKDSNMTEPSMRAHTHTHTHIPPRSWFQHAGSPEWVSGSCLLHWEHSLRHWTAGIVPAGLTPPRLAVTFHLCHEFSPLLVQGWGGTVGFGECEWGQRTLSYLQMCALILGS